MPTPMDFTIRPISSESDWIEAKRIREVVFIEEQGCPPEEEWDEWEESARHFVLLLGPDVVGTARWRAYSSGEHPAAKLERFALLANVRQKGLGKALIAAVLEDAQRAGFTRFVLHAQHHLTGLYGAFGFESVGPLFDEAGIPHQRMVLGFSA